MKLQENLPERTVLFRSDGHTEGWTDGQMDMTRLLLFESNLRKYPNGNLRLRRVNLASGRLTYVTAVMWQHNFVHAWTPTDCDVTTHAGFLV